MANVRSPRYPNAGLGKALEHARWIYDAERQKDVSRAAIAGHLGHRSLSGPASSKSGLMPTYGILEDVRDELRVTDDAARALRNRFRGDGKAAVARLAFKPAIFREIRNDFPAMPPDEKTVRDWLVRQKFTARAARMAANAFRETMELLASVGGSYSLPAQPPRAVASTPVAEPDGGQRKLPQRAASGAVKRDVLSVKEGDVVLQWPVQLSLGSFHELQEWAALIIRKIERSVQHGEKRGGTLGGNDHGHGAARKAKLCRR